MTTSTHTEASILNVIAARRSRRAYSDKPVGPDVIESLFESARWAPSSMNEQPWHYVYAVHDQHELREKILASMSANNRSWAQAAPLLIASFARKKHSRSNHPNPMASYDVGGANALLSLQATESGLNVHQIAGFDKDILIRNLNVPFEDFDPLVIIAIGYPGDPEQLPEVLKMREEAPRLRYRKSEFVKNNPF